MSLRSKLATSFLLVLAPVLGLLVYDYLNDYGQQRHTVLEGESRMAESLGGLLDATFDRGVAVGRALAIDPIVQTFDPTRLDPFLAGYLPVYPEYESINVWNAAGENVGVSVPLPRGEPRPNISDRDHFQQVMATGEPAVSDLIVSRTTRLPTVAAVVPIVDREDRLIGAVSLLIDVMALPEMLSSIQLGPDRAIFATDRMGRLMLHTARREMTWEERDASRYEPVREALSRGHFADTVDKSLIGDTRLEAAARTPKYGAVVGVSIPEATVRGEVLAGTLPRLGIYLGIVLIAGLLAFGLTLAITRPLGDLNRAIAAFGRGELGRRLEVRTGDELETTSEAFNRMASALQREQDRLGFLGEVGATLTSALEVKQIMQLLAERTTGVLCDVTWVYLLPEGDLERCELAGAHADDPAILERMQALVEENHEWVTKNLAAPVTQTGEPILIRDVASSELEESLRRQLVDLGATSLMVVPLQARGHPVGLFVCLSLTEECWYGEEELALAMDLAGRAGVVVDNALLLQQVRGERQRLQTVLETVPVGVAVAEAATGRITTVSRAGQAILGKHSVGAPLDRWPKEYGLYRLNGEPYPPGEDPLARTLFRGEGCVGEELIVRQPSGREVCVLANSAPLKDAEGRVVGAVAAFQDITSLKEIQRRMEGLAQEAERRRSEMDALIEGVGEGITLADGEGRIVRVNSRGREIWAFPPLWERQSHLSEFADQLDLRYPDDSPIPFDRWPLARAIRGEVFSGEEVIYRRADGRSFHLLFSSGVVRDERGQVTLAMSIYGDITPIRELERAREEFISVIAHDLRSPLTVITGFAGLLQRIPVGQHGQDQEQRAVDSILSSAKRLEKMVADLLDASRIEARRLVLALESLDLRKLLHEVAERSAEIAPGHPVRVEVHGEVPEMRADPARLEQVLGNLLSNAAKYSFPDSDILLEAECRAGEVVISVTNQGAGISPEEQEAIFTRFRRTREAAAGKVPGLGLGLYISRGLVEAHGGRLWVESEAGKYATFRFSLPLPERSAES